MDNAVIVSGARTPIGRYGGAFKAMNASDLGSIAIKSAIERSGIKPSDVELKKHKDYLKNNLKKNFF